MGAFDQIKKHPVVTGAIAVAIVLAAIVSFLANLTSLADYWVAHPAMGRFFIGL